MHLPTYATVESQLHGLVLAPESKCKMLPRDLFLLLFVGTVPMTDHQGSLHVATTVQTVIGANYAATGGSGCYYFQALPCSTVAALNNFSSSDLLAVVHSSNSIQ